MRPGLKLDEDHVNRTKRYVYDIRNYLDAQSGNDKRLDEAYIIAEIPDDGYLIQITKEVISNRIYFKNWDTLLQEAGKQYEEYLDILKQRNPEDPRISIL